MTRSPVIEALNDWRFDNARNPGKRSLHTGKRKERKLKEKKMQLLGTDPKASSSFCAKELKRTDEDEYEMAT